MAGSPSPTRLLTFTEVGGGIPVPWLIFFPFAQPRSASSWRSLRGSLSAPSRPPSAVLRCGLLQGGRYKGQPARHDCPIA